MCSEHSTLDGGCVETSSSRKQGLQGAVYLNVGGPGVYLLLGVGGDGPDEASL